MIKIEELVSIAYFTFNTAKIISKNCSVEKPYAHYHYIYQSYLFSNDMFYREISKLVKIN